MGKHPFDKLRTGFLLAHGKLPSLKALDSGIPDRDDDVFPIRGACE
ncbi:MAG: hypothetical protein NTX45_20455 [Proteobacteria bacterium]|nr:hypothetical protein [Pseudomonadota bacterium]